MNMKIVPIATVFGLVLTLNAVVLAQGSPVRTPQVILDVTRHRLGADVFSIGVVRREYPAEVLRAQVSAFGANLGSPPRGLTLTRENVGNGGQLRATFAVDGFVDPLKGIVRLDALAKAFAPSAGGPFDLTLIINGFAPTQATIRSFSSEAVDISASQYGNSLEYQISIKASDPALILIPIGTEPIAQANPSGKASQGPDWTFWGLLAVAGIAVGALVYSLVLRPASMKRR